MQGAANLSGWARALTRTPRPIPFHTDNAGQQPTRHAASPPDPQTSFIPGHASGTSDYGHAANDSLLALTDRIIVDESQPFYLASLPGVLQTVNDAYRTFMTEAGMTEAGMTEVDGALPGPGTVEVGMMVSHAHQRLLKQVADSGTTVVTEEWFGPQGQQRCWRGRHFPIKNSAGDLVAVAGTYTEITLDLTMRQDAIYARRRFSDFARAASDWFWETDRQGKLTLLSERFAASAGLPAAVFYKQPLTDLGRSGTDPSLVRRLQQALADRVPFRNIPVEIKAADSAIRRCHLSGVPVFDTTDGTFMGFRGAGMDITQMHRNAVRAAEMRQNLQ